MSPKSSRKHRSGAGSSKRSYHRQRSTRARAHISPPEVGFEPAVSPQPAGEADDDEVCLFAMTSRVWNLNST